MWIAEPSTALTDYLLTIECLFFSLRLYRMAPSSGGRLWMLGFLALGIGALVGGSFHGFRPFVSPRVSTFLWNASMVLIGTAAGFMISGLVASTVFPARRWMLAGLAISVAGALLLALKVGIRENFNHNDLFHCVMLVALYSYYRGALLLQSAVS